MAQPPAQPSGSEVSQVESDIQQTLDLAGTIVTLVREPISLLYQSVIKAQNLKRSLGIWQERVLDSNGYCSIPVLRLKEFEEYLVSLDGVIPASTGDQQSQNSDDSRTFRMSWDWPSFKRPRSSSSSRPTLPAAGTACWAYFLFAMSIHPGTEINIDCNRKKIVDRKPSTDGFINTQNGGIEMEVDGAVLCHVFNLYTQGYPQDPSTLQHECVLPFGRFAWDSVGTQTQLHAHFSPGVETELVSEKRPFDRDETLMEGNVMTSYLNAVYHDVSDSRYQLAASHAPLSERLNRLVTCFEMLFERNREVQRGRSHDLLLMSSEWFENAARVKRRVLTQGGTDHSFFQDIKKRYGENWEKTDGEDFFLVGTNTIEFFWPPPGNRNPSRRRRLSPMEAIRDVLSCYKGCPAGSWKRSLFEMREDVLRALNIPNVLHIKNDLRRVKVLFFTPGSDLWNQTVLLGAPTSTSGDRTSSKQRGVKRPLPLKSGSLRGDKSDP